MVDVWANTCYVRIKWEVSRGIFWKSYMHIGVQQVQRESMCLYETNPRILMNVLTFMVLYKNKLYLYILCVTFCQFVSPYYLWFVNLVGSICLWNHCKYMIIYLILIYILYVCLFHWNKIKLCVSNQKTTSSNFRKCHDNGVYAG